MRELEFRVWIKPLKRYATGYELVSYHKQCNMRANWWVNVSPKEGYYGKDIIIEQYTGLKDKNGKEIYEGDIVKVSGDTEAATVGYDAGSFVLDCTHCSAQWALYRLGSIRINLDNLCEEVEVIGNIHENKELVDDQ